MKLGGEAILEQFQTANWRAYRHDEPIPMDELTKMIGPNSVDVTLHKTVLWPRQNINAEIPLIQVGVEGVMTTVPPIDPYDPDALSWVRGDIEEKGFVIQPGCMVLGAVRERFVCHSKVAIHPNDDAATWYNSTFAPMCEGRSTCGRLGIEVHLSAGFGDYGFGGAFTLEIKNNFPFPIILYAGMRIAQIAFEEVYRPTRYKGAYSEENHHDGPVAPKLGKERF